MFVKPRSAFVGNPSVVASSSGSAKNARYARLFPSTRKSSESRAGASSSSSSRPVERLRRHRDESIVAAMARIPLLAGTRPLIATAPDDAVILRPPPPGRGRRRRRRGRPRRAALPARGRAARGARPAPRPRDDRRRAAGAPDPGRSTSDPRQLAIGAVVDELERLGIPSGYQTILVACGLARRTTQRELESLVTRELARRFHGQRRRPRRRGSGARPRRRHVASAAARQSRARRDGARRSS